MVEGFGASALEVYLLLPPQDRPFQSQSISWLHWPSFPIPVMGGLWSGNPTFVFASLHPAVLAGKWWYSEALYPAAS